MRVSLPNASSSAGSAPQVEPPQGAAEPRFKDYAIVAWAFGHRRPGAMAGPARAASPSAPDYSSVVSSTTDSVNWITRPPAMTAPRRGQALCTLVADGVQLTSSCTHRHLGRHQTPA